MRLYRRLCVLASACLLAACSSDSGNQTPFFGGGAGADTGSSAPTDTSDGSGADSDAGQTDAGQTVDFCEAEGLSTVAFNTEGPFGTLRRDLAEDFSLETAAGTVFTLSEQWTGCDTYIFLPETIPVAQNISTSIWEEGVAGLLARSPRNVHYIFVPQGSVQSGQFIELMEQNIGVALAELSEEDAAHWTERLHVAGTHVGNIDSWIAEPFGGIGSGGFAIDRFQRVRGVGSFADVERNNPSAGQWPFEQNIALAALEAIYFNYEAERAAEIAAVDATEVVFWDGEILEEYEDITVTLPSAEEMQQFDTLEIYLDAFCPNEGAVEFGNCGAWDYLAHLWVFEDNSEEAARIEVGRFITTYHRAGSYIVDATPLLPELAEGGERRFRWEFAPSWNTQPTNTHMRLRFSNQGRGMRPVQATPLFSGKAFNSQYNEGRERVTVSIPEDAEKVELWAIITGHGGATNNCAEFCNHQHEFIINDRSFFREHPDVGNPTACMDRVHEGVVPNQSGTWWYGRGGWCPGQQVEPYIEDVTDVITPGEDAVVDYFGLFNGGTPPDDSGNIVMTSYLVVYQ